MATATGTPAHADHQHGVGPDQTLLSRVQRHVRARPEAPAVLDDRGRSFSYEQLWERSGEMAELFRTAGAESGQVILMMLPNRAEYQVAFVGALRAGLVPATIPTTTSDVALEQMLGRIGARLLLGHGEAGGSGLARLRRAAAASPWQCDVLVMSEAGEIAPHGTEPGTVPSPVQGELAHLMFTSSTTGLPKAVMHTEATLAALNTGFAERFGLDWSTPVFMPSPLGHSVGGIHGIRLALHLGAELVLQDRWDPDRALELVDTTGAAFTAAATPFLRDLLDTPPPSSGVKLGSVRAFLCGGAHVPPRLLDRCAQEFPHTFVTVLWGMTEGGVTTCVPGDESERVLETAGRGLPGLQLRVLDPQGKHLPPGAEGELSMRGPGVFVGYLGQPELYESLTTRDGFFRTGDLAVLDDEGYVRITGRAKDLIVRGGVNLSPVPTEDVLAGHPDILDVAVIGAPEERLGERICAVVAARRELELDELLTWCQSQDLDKRQWPERVINIESFPRTAAGKIRKVQLRAALFPAEPTEGPAS